MEREALEKIHHLAGQLRPGEPLKNSSKVADLLANQ
jgi:hypothetical protein